MKYQFSDCTLDDVAMTLARGGASVAVEPQVIDLLLLMARNPGVLLSKDRLIDEIWGGRIVSDSAISARISAARTAVGDDGKAQAIIRTVPRRGFQFVAEVSGAPEVAPLPAGPRPEIRYATADDGAKIAWSASGQGPPVMRVGHFPSHLELEWAERTEHALFERIGRARRLIRLDPRGSGLSDLDVEDFSVERIARDMAHVADAAGCERLALLGTSGGSLAAVTFAALFPERVSHLVLLGGYVEGRERREGATQGGDSITRMIEEGWDMPESPFVSGYLSIYFPTASTELLKIFAANVQASCPRENEIRGRTCHNRYSLAPLLEKVRAPTLVLHARRDAVHPVAQAQKMARGIADARLKILETANHYPFPEEACWEDMMRAIEAFWSEGG